MSYRAPIEEQHFVLEHVVDLPSLALTDRFGGATPELVNAILEGAASLAEGVFAPLNRAGDLEGARWDKGVVHMPPGFGRAYEAFVAGGWGSLGVASEHGGHDMPFVLSSAVFECLGGANMAFGLIVMLTVGAVEAIAAHGSPALQAKWLPKLVTGEWNGTMNLTEPQAGSDVGALKTMATLGDDGIWRLKGQKIFITFGDHDLTENIVHLVLARTPDAPAGTRGISLFLVPKFRLGPAGTIEAANDVRCVAIEHKLGIHASPTCVMSFGDDGDCQGELVGELHGGMKAMFTMMNNARINVGNQGVQIAEAATQKAIAFASERVQSPALHDQAGRGPVPIARHPDVQRMLLRMDALTQGARSLVYYAAGLADRAHLGDARAKARLGLLTPLAKAWATDVGCEVASLGIQVHGGMGYVEETGAAQYLRDARITPIYEGTNGIQAIDLVMRKLHGDGGAAFWSLLDDIDKDILPNSGLHALVCAARRTGEALLRQTDVYARLFAAVPFQSMFAVCVAGWLLKRQNDAIASGESSGKVTQEFLRRKQVVIRYFNTCIAGEAIGWEWAVRTEDYCSGLA